MSFNKETIIALGGDDIEVIDSELIKTAAFKLPDNIVYDPDFLYMWVKGVSAGESWGDNKNNDWFPRRELENNYSTFLSAHVFKNHENKDIKNAIGDVLQAKWNAFMDCVKLLLRIDGTIAPSIVRGFQKGYMTDVSMGCRVEYSICSICGNKAKTPKEYCEHVRFERGKIYDDGRKVFEINIGPKFHDISAVLNGAEKTAKVTGIYIPDSKVASIGGSRMEKAAGTFLGGLEKVASFQPRMVGGKIASIDLCAVPEKRAGIDLIGKDLFPDQLMDKRAYAHKIAELKKEIDATIESVSDAEVTDHLVEQGDSVRNIFKMVSENYWDEENCVAIADILRQMAEDKGVSLQEVFCQFLNVVSFAGSELAPKEFFMIADALFDLPPSDATEEYSDEKEEDFARAMTAPSLKGNSMESLINAALSAIHGGHSEHNLPALPKAVKGITIMAVLPRKEYAFTKDIGRDIMRVLSPRLAERSFFSPNMVKKASNQNNNQEYWKLPDHFIKQAMYLLYQNDRTDRFGSPVYLKKAADFITENFLMEKVAGSGYTKAKAWALGLPVTFGYSAYQRARMKNGENIGSVNRYIAENPASAYLIQAIFGPMVYKGGLKGIQKVKNAGNSAYWGAANATGKVKMSEIVYGTMEKTAGVPVDSIEAVKQYDQDQEKILKTAGLMIKAGYEDAAQTILSKSKLSEEDLDGYLQIQKNAAISDITGRLQKDAKAISVLGKIPPSVDFDRVVMQAYVDQF